MQQQHGTLRQRQSVQLLHERGLLLLPDEQLVGPSSKSSGTPAHSSRRSSSRLPSPMLNTLLMRDAKQPTAEFLIVTQAGQVPNRVKNVSCTTSRLVWS
jgi:hypothetical protein